MLQTSQLFEKCPARSLVPVYSSNLSPLQAPPHNSGTGPAARQPHLHTMKVICTLWWVVQSPQPPSLPPSSPLLSSPLLSSSLPQCDSSSTFGWEAQCTPPDWFIHPCLYPACYPCLLSHPTVTAGLLGGESSSVPSTCMCTLANTRTHAGTHTHTHTLSLSHILCISHMQARTQSHTERIILHRSRCKQLKRNP